MRNMDLVGEKFGRLKVVSQAETRVTPSGRNMFMWNCVCDCGKKKIISTWALRSGNTMSCGCYQKERAIESCLNDFQGKKFGRLTAIRYIGNSYWECKCDCGNTKNVLSQHLRRGLIRSCGCWRREAVSECQRKHGMALTRIYKIWLGMRDRCKNENRLCFVNYGGRGISVCDEWSDDFISFKNWAFANGYRDDLTIDRIDVNGDYEPSNCRWITMEEQANNKRVCVYLEYEGKTQTIAEWAREKGIKYQTLYRRLRYYGWSVEKAIETPVQTF